MNIKELELKEIENVVEALKYDFSLSTTTHFSDYMRNDIEPFFEMIKYINNDIEIENETEEGIAMEKVALLYRLCQMCFGEYIEAELASLLPSDFKINIQAPK